MVDDKRRRIRRTLEEVSKLIRQVCLAIKDLHDIDVIHRDIKPENILLSMVLTGL